MTKVQETFTVGKVAARFGLSRSTLLYYDRIGLLCPSARSDANYRVYSNRDIKRLEQICFYRKTGLALEDIADILNETPGRLTEIFERRLSELNRDIRELREQQQVIVNVLKNRALYDQIDVMDKKRWVQLLTDCGFNEADMQRWHSLFELNSPNGHQQFLEFLGIPAGEIRQIRVHSRKLAR